MDILIFETLVKCNKQQQWQVCTFENAGFQISHQKVKAIPSAVSVW